MGQSWWFEISVTPKKGKFDEVKKRMLEMNLPFETEFKPDMDFNKKFNAIYWRGGTYASYGYGKDLASQLTENLKGLIESGAIEMWFGDYPQSVFDLVTGEEIQTSYTIDPRKEIIEIKKKKLREEVV